MCAISIHALREEGDLRQAVAVQQYYISIHALREEGDSKNRENTLCFCFSIHGFAQNGKHLKTPLGQKRCFLCKNRKETGAKPLENLCSLPGRTGSKDQGVPLCKGRVHTDVLYL